VILISNRRCNPTLWPVFLIRRLIRVCLVDSVCLLQRRLAEQKPWLSPQGREAQMEMNKTGQNCEEKADHQVIEKNEQRRVNDSNCCRRCNLVASESLHPFSPRPLVASALALRVISSSHHRGGVTICDTGNFFHSPQYSREVFLIMVCQLR
jgi:hypothetical protein